MRLLAPLIVAFFMIGPARAQVERYVLNDVSQFLDACRDALKNPEQHGFLDAMHYASCFGYVTGVAASLTQNCIDAHSEMWTEDSSTFLTAYGIRPDGYSNEELVKTVIKFAEDNPNLWNEGLYQIVWSGLRNAAPCPQLAAKR